MYFFASAGETRQLWRTDGSSQNTTLVADVPGGTDYQARAQDLTAVGSADDPGGSTLFFTVDDGTHGRELWRSPGDSSGAEMVKDIVGGSAGSHPASLTSIGGEVFFTAANDDGPGLWASDGTGSGTRLLMEGYFHQILPVPEICGALLSGTSVGTEGFELWITDGTATGTRLLQDINPGAESSNPEDLRRVGDSIYLAADDGLHGAEPWQIRVADLVAAVGGPSPCPANAPPVKPPRHRDSESGVLEIFAGALSLSWLVAAGLAGLASKRRRIRIRS